MTQAIQPIPTTYRGYRFRSRLEARWAVYFDDRKIAFDYEPEGFPLPGGGGYLPDFWLPQVSMWAEVKPGEASDRLAVDREIIHKATVVALGTNHPFIILDGPPRNTNFWGIWPDDMEPVGWDWNDVLPDYGKDYHLSEGRFFACTGATPLEHWTFDGESQAVVKARGARFERGE
jgi:hypothetical protein